MPYGSNSIEEGASVRRRVLWSTAPWSRVSAVARALDLRRRRMSRQLQLWVRLPPRRRSPATGASAAIALRGGAEIRRRRSTHVVGLDAFAAVELAAPGPTGRAKSLPRRAGGCAAAVVGGRVVRGAGSDVADQQNTRFDGGSRRIEEDVFAVLADDAADHHGECASTSRVRVGFRPPPAPDRSFPRPSISTSAARAQPPAARISGLTT